MFRGREEEVEEVKEEGFSLLVTHRHPKTGLVTKKDPYILRVVREGGNKVRYFERPAGSGNLWNKKGEPIGRWDASKPEGDRFLKGAEHVQWTPPETEDQKLARSVAEKDARIQELEKELAAIEAEKSARSAGKVSAQAKKDQGA